MKPSSSALTKKVPKGSPTSATSSKTVSPRIPVLIVSDMNAQIIEVKLEEIENNFDFCLTLVERGHTIKITQDDKPAVLMVPVPDYQKALDVIETANNPPLPLPEGWQPDPVGVRQYVSDELAEMQKELNS